MEKKTSWLQDVRNVVTRLPGRTFKLADVYGKCRQFQRRHPGNQNIKAKIRQQLQRLRDLGEIVFTRPGVYRKKKS